MSIEEELAPGAYEALVTESIQRTLASTRLQATIDRLDDPEAARRLADRFDHYHFRRPGMILEWERGKKALSPAAGTSGSRKTCLRTRPASAAW